MACDGVICLNFRFVVYMGEMKNPLIDKGFRWWAHRDLKPEPTDYESGALTN